jgi:uncharacterized protein (DUF885 family)
MQRTPTRAALAALVLAGLAAGCHPAPPAVAPSPAAEVERAAAEYHRQSLSDFPEFGTFLGTGEFDDRLSDNSLSARDARLERLSRMLDVVRALHLQVIPHAQAVTLAMLQTEVEKELATDVCQTQIWDVNPLDGPQVNLLQLQSFQPIPTPERGGKLLSRYRQMPRYLDTHVANLAAGLSRGYRAPRVAVERVISQLDTLLATPDSALALLDPVRTKPEAWPDAEWAAYRAELGGVVHDSVIPAFRRYREFLATQYLPRARAEVGVSANPNGAECYRARIRAETSLDLAPDEVHRTGLSEMAKIHAEMREITRRRFGTEDLLSVFARLREDARYAFATREEVEKEANTAVDRARERLPDAFGRLPQAAVVVKRLEAYQEKDAPAAYYFPPAADGSRPGAYMVNTFQPTSRPRYTAEVLAYHEGVPGHHLQIAIQQELEALPAFRRFAGTTAFVEGWGLYSERLADEMGLYSDDLQRLGMLSFEAWRAARLVTDAGMHALGWTREQAITYMLQNTALTPLDAANEIDRYIVWPGQALAYKTGQLEILRLRDEARRRLGERFDLRGFHDVVLGSGAVTLPILRQQVESWISTQEAAL